MVFQPASVPGLALRNRLVMAPMTTYSSHDDGSIHPDELAYLARRSRGGFGMVMTAACYVHKSGHAFPGQWSCSRDEDLPSLRSAVDAIQSGGAAAVLQIHHGGRQAPSRLCRRPVSASAIPSARPEAETPHAMTEEEIREVVEAFGQAARRAVEAGFDGIEIHGANTYLLQQFVSPHSNRREDRWGGDRLKFPLAVMDAVLAAVPTDYPIGYRFSPEEVETPGLRISDTLRLVDALTTRPIAWLHVSLGRFDQPSLVGDYVEPTLTLLARHLRGRCPLIGVGNVWTREDANRALRTGANLVAVGRAAIVDPEWPASVQSTGEPARRLFPADGPERLLTAPAGLVQRVRDAPGWFEVEPAE